MMDKCYQYMQQIFTCAEKETALCQRCYKMVKPQLAQYYQQQRPIQFVLPGYPAKSANRTKTLSSLPDFGEVLSLKYLADWLAGFHQYYLPGARLIICSDGYVFNDIVGVSKEDVLGYNKALKNIVEQYCLNDIEFYCLSDHYHQFPIEKCRQQLMDEFAQPFDVIKQSIFTNENERKLFNGLHRFIKEDIALQYAHLSKNQLTKIAKQKTYQTIQRSHAWSGLVKQQFPQAIRLSIHPHCCGSEKIGIRLLPQAEQWATPWHNVLVKRQYGWVFVKRHLAEKAGAVLRQGVQDYTQYYIGEIC